MRKLLTDKILLRRLIKLKGTQSQTLVENLKILSQRNFKYSINIKHNKHAHLSS